MALVGVAHAPCMAGLPLQPRGHNQNPLPPSTPCVFHCLLLLGLHLLDVLSRFPPLSPPSPPLPSSSSCFPPASSSSPPSPSPLSCSSSPAPTCPRTPNPRSRRRVGRRGERWGVARRSGLEGVEELEVEVGVEFEIELELELVLGPPAAALVDVGDVVQKIFPKTGS